MSEFTSTQTELLAEMLKARDRQLRDEIHAVLLQSEEERYIDLAGRVHDLADESVADMLIDLESSLVDRHLLELREIEAARARLAEGSIDRCIECGQDIGFERLLANPVAVRCLVCQDQKERKVAHEAMPKL